MATQCSQQQMACDVLISMFHGDELHSELFGFSGDQAEMVERHLSGRRLSRMFQGHTVHGNSATDGNA